MSGDSYRSEIELSNSSELRQSDASKLRQSDDSSDDETTKVINGDEYINKLHNSSSSNKIAVVASTSKQEFASELRQSDVTP